MQITKRAHQGACEQVVSRCVRQLPWSTRRVVSGCRLQVRPTEQSVQSVLDTRQCPERCPQFTRANVLNPAMVWGWVTCAQTGAKTSNTTEAAVFNLFQRPDWPIGDPWFGLSRAWTAGSNGTMGGGSL
jgi:hypothetical protein